MINNRQNGRRRGRGGQQPRGMSGNSSGNARDNRQRGNAAQLHEKYKSMARDAQLSGDRVQTEYYLQFADHYFRMLGDARPRFDEQKRGRDDDQDDDSDDRMESDMDNDGDGESDGDDGDQPQRQGSQNRNRPAGDRNNGDRNTNDRNNSDRAESRRDRPVADRGNNDRAANDRSEPRRANGRARDDDNRGRSRESARDEDGERIDFAVLPPAIGMESDSDDGGDMPRAAEVGDEQEAPRPRRRTRRPRDEDDASAS